MATLTPGYQILRYPKTKVEEYDDYLEIQILEYKPPGLGTTNGTGFQIKSSDSPDSQLSEKNKKIKSTIILPIPKDLSPDAKSVEWGEDRMSSLAAAAAGGAKDIIQSSNLVKSIFNKVQSGAAKVAGAVDGNTQQALAAGLGAAAINQLLGQDSDPFAAITRQTGAVLNQNQELLFKGVSLRDFVFNFTMTPRFREEAEEIRNIIRFFKQSSSAKKSVVTGAGSQGLFIGSPDVYQIAYKSGKQNHPYLNQFKICALLSMSVNYGGAGVYATYPDGSPVQTNMSLSFRELTPVYYEDYDTEKGKLGSGY